MQFEKAGGERVLVLLEAISAGTDPDGPLPDGWYVGEAMKAIEKSGITSRRQLALLEFRYFRALERSEYGTKNLYAEMLEDPALFVECACLAYQPHSQPRTDEPANEALRTAASLILHQGRGVPGDTAGDGIDRAKFDAWIADVRKLAAEQDRRNTADLTIGGWLSSSPADTDGTWPCLPVRDLLERQDAENIRRGFHTGVINNRGTHSRAVDAGGGQERDLAAQYRMFAAPLLGSHPQTAAVLESIAKSYDSDARRHDLDSALWKEGAH